MLVPEASFTLEEVHAGALEMPAQLFLRVHLVHDLACAFEEPGKIDGGPCASQPIRAELVRITYEPSGFGQHTGRHAAIVSTGSAVASALYQCDRRAELARAESRGYARGSAANNDQV